VQSDQLRALLSAIVALAFLAMVTYTVRRLSDSTPTRIAATLAALTGLCGALPAILYAMH
jgi:mannose/fructose/N-acetylgalactosamine-specific phosphotransferase system component IIC